jgi:hypothetical protein
MAALLAAPQAAARAAAPSRRRWTPARCAASQHAPPAPHAPHAAHRRDVLAAAAAAALLLPAAAPRRAAAEGDAETWSRYTRAFRSRFETSISSATRAYTFEYPASWTPGAAAVGRTRARGWWTCGCGPARVPCPVR